jgi:hypothetical protein
VAQVAPEELVSLPGIATDSATTTLLNRGLKDNRDQRLRSEASFANLSVRGRSHRSLTSGKVV